MSDMMDDEGKKPEHLKMSDGHERIAWAAQSASENAALQRALQMIKSQASFRRRSPATAANFGLHQSINPNSIHQGRSRQLNQANDDTQRCTAPKESPNNEIQEKSVEHIPKADQTNPSSRPNPPMKVESSSLLTRAKDYVPNGEMEVVTRMPMVVTNGGIAGGRITQGFLYKLGGEEELMIMCVCHGLFFSAGEFVKHGGGGDVENPTRLITMAKTPF